MRFAIFSGRLPQRSHTHPHSRSTQRPPKPSASLSLAGGAHTRHTHTHTQGGGFGTRIAFFLRRFGSKKTKSTGAQTAPRKRAPMWRGMESPRPPNTHCRSSTRIAPPRRRAPDPSLLAFPAAIGGRRERSGCGGFVIPLCVRGMAEVFSFWCWRSPRDSVTRQCERFELMYVGM